MPKSEGSRKLNGNSRDGTLLIVVDLGIKWVCLFSHEVVFRTKHAYSMGIVLVSCRLCIKRNPNIGRISWIHLTSHTIRMYCTVIYSTYQWLHIWAWYCFSAKNSQCWKKCLQQSDSPLCGFPIVNFALGSLSLSFWLYCCNSPFCKGNAPNVRNGNED